jgi:hypothetical protein
MKKLLLSIVLSCVMVVAGNAQVIYGTCSAVGGTGATIRQAPWANNYSYAVATQMTILGGGYVQSNCQGYCTAPLQISISAGMTATWPCVTPVTGYSGSSIAGTEAAANGTISGLFGWVTGNNFEMCNGQAFIQPQIQVGSPC